MSWPEAIAFCALMIGVISGAGIWLDAHNTRLKNRAKELELQVRLAEAEAHKRVAGVPEMEDRLRVLERIATARSPVLADEIEALRKETIIGIAIWGLVEIYKARQGIVTDWAGNETRAPVEDEAAKRELEELRERIKVLERIATEGNTLDAGETRRIASEIEKLRDS